MDKTIIMLISSPHGDVVLNLETMYDQYDL